MRVLWVCNVMLPSIAKQLGREASNKEGWVSGLAEMILSRQKENGIVLGIAFPMERDGFRGEIKREDGGRFQCYGFEEDVNQAHVYQARLEESMAQILKEFQPDVVHCFGTEYGHTLAVTRICDRPQRILVGLQGLCAVYANTYMASMPEKVRKSVTFRDWLKKDTLVMQQQKFVKRGEMERESVKRAGNVTGRTDWDRYYAAEWNPQVSYYAMNETLRPAFYSDCWKRELCQPYTIFLSQGDYPIKGLHYMLLALPGILERFPKVRVCVAGNSLVEDKTWKDRIRLSAYGKYLKDIMRKYQLTDKVTFLGRLDAERMKAQYLASGLFVCCSTLENSPNSLAEAMLLGMPCVSADVGGIPSLFRDRVDGILYRGYRSRENSFDNICDEKGDDLRELTESLKNAVIEMLSDLEKAEEYGRNARKHALITHDRERNYYKLMEIYADINNK